MAVEIERKFLVANEGWRSQVQSSSAYRQGYLSSNDKATVRVRSLDDSEAFLTLKGKVSGMSRAEFEYGIPIADARALLAIAEPHIIEKRRFIVLYGGLTWEVDVFQGKHVGLVIAEVELESETQHVDLPDWVGREVTGDERFYNASLSRADRAPS